MKILGIVLMYLGLMVVMTFADFGIYEVLHQRLEGGKQKQFKKYCFSDRNNVFDKDWQIILGWPVELVVDVQQMYRKYRELRTME